MSTSDAYKVATAQLRRAADGVRQEHARIHQEIDEIKRKHQQEYDQLKQKSTQMERLTGSAPDGNSRADMLRESQQAFNQAEKAKQAGIKEVDQKLRNLADKENELRDIEGQIREYESKT